MAGLENGIRANRRRNDMGKPGRDAAIAGLILLVGLALLAAGAPDLMDDGPRAGLFGLGLFVTIMGAVFFAGFLWAARIVRAMRGGRTAIARWTLSPEEFARWREIDRRFTERGEPNDYRAPSHVPAGGLEVIFSDTGVLIGDRYFGLATTGLNHFTSVRPIGSDPPMIEFGTVETKATSLSVVRVWKARSVLRVPVASTAAFQGEKVARRYQDIVSRRVIVKPHFWTRRIRGGLIVAAVSALLGITGVLVAMNGPPVGESAPLTYAPPVLAVGGVIFAIGGLIVALAAWSMRRSQYRGLSPIQAEAIATAFKVDNAEAASATPNAPHPPRHPGEGRGPARGRRNAP
jgi:hypothetical protein